MVRRAQHPLPVPAAYECAHEQEHGTVACGACGGRAGKWVSGEVAVHLGPPVLDKVERSWSCWRHPNASGVGVNVASAMGNTRFSRAPWDFLLLFVECRINTNTRTYSHP